MPPFPPLKFAYKFEMKEDYISRKFKDIRIKKASWKSQSNTHKLKWALFFIVEYNSCFFYLSLPFLIISILCFLYICIYEPDMFRQIFSSGKLTAWLLDSLFILAGRPHEQI